MSLRRTLLPALGTSLAFSLGSGEALVFQPQAGATLTKTFTTTSNLELDDLSLLVSGQDVGEMIGEIAISIEQEGKIEVTDTYKATAGGRPTELLRSFEALTASMNFDISPAPPAEMPQVESASELEGKSVLFKWNPEEEAYDRSFPDGEGDEELLEGLEEDMDLRFLLPGKEVAADETWTVELSELGLILMPGGDLRMMPKDAEVDREAMERFAELFSGFTEKYKDQLEGACTCTYKGTRDEDGVRVAEIAIELEVAAALDLTEILSEIVQQSIEESGAGDQVQFSFDSADLSMDFDGSGTLLWNPATGLVHAFQIGGDVGLSLDLAVGIEAMGESQDMDASLEMSGSMEQVLETRQ